MYNSIVESHLPDEIVKCKCGMIAVCDGPAMRMWPANSPFFVRVDDQGNEIVVKYVSSPDSEKDEQSPNDDKENLSIQDAIEALERSIQYNEQLPYHEQFSFVTTNEVTAYLRSILHILKSL